MTTDRQKAAVHFCEQCLDVTFEGDIENRYEVSAFLSKYLQEAKNLYKEIARKYESYPWDSD